MRACVQGVLCLAEHVNVEKLERPHMIFQVLASTDDEILSAEFSFQVGSGNKLFSLLLMAEMCMKIVNLPLYIDRLLLLSSSPMRV